MSCDWYIMDVDGKPQNSSAEEWSEWNKNYQNKQVAETFVEQSNGDKIRVSTVFLGLDHAFDEDTPILFETLVFEGPMDEEMFRYSTIEEAQEGHKKMVREVEKCLKVSSN